MMGDWVYYCCLMDFATLADRVNYAKELHKSEQLAEMIQRQLKSARSEEIANYLTTQSDRLFNALVIATYGGKPNWHALTNVRSKGDSEQLSLLTEETILSVGFLTLRGDEKLFVLDGQHRLSGIKRSIDLAGPIPHLINDQVPVIFVAHETTEPGMKRTRRLFTTLNKMAKPVSKFDIIALDEDDVMALTVRWLIDENPEMFGDDRIAFVASSNMPKSNLTSLTTIVSLYDILYTWFAKAETGLATTPAKLKKSRQNENELGAYYQLAHNLFNELELGFPELGEFFSARDTKPIISKYRNRSVLFRPAGLRIFVTIVAMLSHEMSLREAVTEAAKLPTYLEDIPYNGLMWNPSSQTIRRFSSQILLFLLLYMLRRPQIENTQLLQRYRNEVGDQSLELPAPVVPAH